jgi:ferrous iron transport protein B
MESIVQETVEMPIQLGDDLTSRIDKILLHPWLGLPIFFAAMYLLFQFIFNIGKPLQDGIAWLLTLFRTNALEPLLMNTPTWLSGLMLDGVYNGIGTSCSLYTDNRLILSYYDNGRRQWISVSCKPS